jgi:hypothetical protein
MNPGQSVIIEVDYTPSSGIENAVVTATFQGSTPGNPTTFITIPLLGTQAGTNFAQPFPNLIFPTTKVGQTSTYANAVIVNTAQVNMTVTSIAMVTGTDFFIVGAPVVPFTINVGAQSAAFSIQFIPTVVGSRNDTLNVVAGGNTASIGVSGLGATLQSAFSLSGGTQGMLFAFPGASAPLILIANPASLNTEEASSWVKLHDFQLPNIEKQWMRIRGHYEDLGPATISFQLRARRVGKPDEIIIVSKAIGTAFADGWIREFATEPTPVSGELVQITASRLANSGPVSLIDYMPSYEPKGEVISGT